MVARSKAKEDALAFDLLHTLFQYEADTGIVRWRVSRSNNVKVGQEVGSLRNDGYMAVKLNGKSYLLHRIIWFMVYGEWPSDVIDHINGDGSDNRLVNMRATTQSANSYNRRWQWKALEKG